MVDTAPLPDSLPLPHAEPFTRRAARAAGVPDKVLHRLVRDGHLVRPIEGVYVASDVPDSLDLRCRVLALVVPEDCFVCDRTAAWLHAGARALAPGEHLQLPALSCFRPSEGGRLRNALTSSGERAIRPRDVVEIGGLRVTTPLRTALDLGRLQPSRDLRLHGMDVMLGLGAFTLDELLLEVPRFDRQRGVVLLRALAPLADGGSESMGESSLRLRWYDAGLPRPTTQVPVEVEGRVVFRLDLGLEELLFAAEYDGEAWHSSEERRRRDAVRRDWLATERGWAVEVFGREQVYGHRQDADVRLKQAFVRARATLGRRTFVV